MAGTYFNNANANSIATDIFRDLFASADEGKVLSDEELLQYGGMNEEDYLCEYCTKVEDAGACAAALARWRAAADPRAASARSAASAPRCPC